MTPRNVKMTFPDTRAFAGRNGIYRYHTELHWHPRNAHAVRIIIANPTTGDRSTFVCDRQLLTDGVNAPAGYGDITITPNPNNDTLIEIVLRDHRGIGGNASLIYKRDHLTAFLNSTYRQVPAGAEHYEWDPADLFGRETA